MSVPSPKVLPPGTVIGRYEVLRLLGRGGMGEVYLAADQALKREVALKLLPQDLSQNPLRLARFHREATLAAALKHPNICTIYEIGEADGLNFIAMEYVEGTNLQERLSAGDNSIEQPEGDEGAANQRGEAVPGA